MCGITQQRHAALRHLARRAHGRTLVQGPQTPMRHRFQACAQIRAHRAHGAEQGAGVGRMVPMFGAHRGVAVHDGHEVQGTAGLHGVLHDVQTRAHPNGDAIAAQVHRPLVLRHQSPVGQVATEPGGSIGQEALAQRAPHAVGGHQGLGRDALAVGQDHVEPIGAVLPMRDRLAQTQLSARDQRGLVQEAVQIGAVEGGVRRAVQRLCALTQTQRPQDPTGLGVQRLQVGRKSRHLRQRFVQAPSLQTTRDVGADLYARPHFAERGGLFDHGDRQALARTGQCRGHATDASACNEQLVRHGAIVPLDHLSASRLKPIAAALCGSQTAEVAGPSQGGGVDLDALVVQRGQDPGVAHVEGVDLHAVDADRLDAPLVVFNGHRSGPHGLRGHVHRLTQHGGLPRTGLGSAGGRGPLQRSRENADHEGGVVNLHGGFAVTDQDTMVWLNIHNVCTPNPRPTSEKLHDR